MSYGAVARIDTQALHHNLAVVKRRAPHSKILAVVKGNGYGHGLLRVARTLSSVVDSLAVANTTEGQLLRDEGVDLPIIVLGGFCSLTELEVMLEKNLTPVVHDPNQVDIIDHYSGAKNAAVWLKIDTGMHRLGFSAEQWSFAHKKLSQVMMVNRLVVMSHLANADDKSSPKTEQQVLAFMAMTAGLGDEKSLENSAGILGLSRPKMEWVRPGIMLYGVSPFCGETGSDYGLRPVMTLVANVISINSHRKGSEVGYGGLWKCPEDMLIAVVGIGYGDGYPRHITENTPVLINGKEAMIVGCVSMDMVCVDLRGHGAVSVGDEVVCWGEGLPVERIADKAGTIAYELLCQVTSRVRFVEASA